METGSTAAGGASTGPHHVEMKEWIACAPFEALLNIEIVTAADGRASLRMPFYREFSQGMGYLHGGVLASLADTAVMIAIKTQLAPGTRFATVSMQMEFLRPLKKGLVTARSEVVERDGRQLKGRAVVFNDDDEPVLEFSSIFRIARRQPAVENGSNH